MYIHTSSVDIYSIPRARGFLQPWCGWKVARVEDRARVVEREVRWGAETERPIGRGLSATSRAFFQYSLVSLIARAILYAL